MSLVWESVLLASLCEGGGSYGGIAAEIGAKNMPPACFFNAPTEGENKRLKFSPPASLTLGMTCCGAQNFAAAFKPPKF